MTKIAFFNRPLVFEGTRDIFEIQDRFIHYGVLSLGTYLKKQGFKVRIFDYYKSMGAGLRRQLRKDLVAFGPDLVGLSAFTTDIENAHQTAGLIKKILGSKTRVILGGPHFSALPRETMDRYSDFDIGVIGEAELTMAEIARGKSLARIKGIVYRKGEKIVKNPSRQELVDINKLPLPAYELFDLGKYVQPTYQGLLKFKKKKLVLPIETTRGCPFQCRFCFRTLGRRVRLKEPKRVVQEIKRIIDKYDVDQIEVIDGTFGISKKQALEICRLIVREGLNRKFKFLVRTRIDTIDTKLAKALKKAGCYYLSIGIEASDDRVLRESGKKITTKQIRETLESIREVGIEVHANFILGLPLETEKKIYEKAEFARSLPIVGANFAILVPFPGTAVYDWARLGRRGYRLRTEDFRFFGKQAGRALVNKRISSRRLKELQKECYRWFYLSSLKRFLVFLAHLDWRRFWGVLRFSRISVTLMAISRLVFSFPLRTR
jgi:radical SAM superfamily enzyme YgiQ (UPF0313 family)